MADVTDATFQEQVIDRSHTVPVVVDLWAPWCGPCRVLGPILEQAVASSGGAVELAKVNVDENPVTAARFNARSIPLLLVIKDGREVDRIVGVQPRGEIERRLRPVTA